MRIDLTPKLRTIDGKFFQQVAPDGTAGDWDADLKEAIYGALIAQLQTDFNLSVQEKIKVFRLAKRVDKATGVISLESDEVTLIKERASKVYGNHLFGTIAELLEGESTLAAVPTAEAGAA